MVTRKRDAAMAVNCNLSAFVLSSVLAVFALGIVSPMTTTTLTGPVLTTSTPEPKCVLVLDEMNCVNATINDLPDSAQLDAKDLKFLDSKIPILRSKDLRSFPLITDFVCLDCGMKEIEKDAFCALRNLIRVELYGNYITVMDPDLFKNCTKIKDLIISWNERLVVAVDSHFVASSTLTSLDLTGNKLTALYPLTFSKLPRLKSLSLSENLLENLPENIFNSLQNLRHLDLSRNKLKTVSLSVFPSKVWKLGLAWNPWHCNCSLFPVVQWSRTRNVNEVHCIDPPRLNWRHFNGSNCSIELVDAIRQRKMLKDRS